MPAPGTTPSATPDDGPRYPGERLGLPESGPRSIARLGRRLAGVTIDWGIAYFLAWSFFQDDQGIVDGFSISAIFVALQIVFLITAAGAPGHLFLGMRVVPMSGGWIGFWRPVVRSLLLAIVIPAVIFDSNQRGLHDRIAGTVLVRR
ncbi:RDD family protein [Marisediminicola sp. LYQ134]|uniref:RDD family protein n=1 Tax=unclassified Marisediminicola TaxID=2618316 RepID=UPI0039838A9E